jgi:hypothetical protein
VGRQSPKLGSRSRKQSPTAASTSPVMAKTKSSPSYVEDGYVEDGYQKRLLEVEAEEGRWIEAVNVVEDVVMFWRDFLKQYRPQEELPQPRNPFTVMPN